MPETMRPAGGLLDALLRGVLLFEGVVLEGALLDGALPGVLLLDGVVLA